MRFQSTAISPSGSITVVRKRRLQAWHCLIPILSAFGVIVGTALFISGLPFLAVPTLAILAIFSFLIIMLARAFQNNL